MKTILVNLVFQARTSKRVDSLLMTYKVEDVPQAYHKALEQAKEAGFTEANGWDRIVSQDVDITYPGKCAAEGWH